VGKNQQNSLLEYTSFDKSDDLMPDTVFPTAAQVIGSGLASPTGEMED
jgi:hypothetical protein